jgi:mRNA interferase MazF
MTYFEAGDIIVVDYPHIETNQLKRRPALVVSTEPIGPDGLVLWAVMITSADNKRWPGDVVIGDHAALGLPIPSVVRTEKFSTLECAGADLICRCDELLLHDVRARIAGNLGLVNSVTAE